jgi:hypothetical protein
MVKIFSPTQFQILVEFTRRNIEAGINCYRSAPTPFFYLKYALLQNIHTSLMAQQFFVAHAIRQTEIPASLDSRVTNTPSVKLFCQQKSACRYISAKNLNILCAGLLKIDKFLFVYALKLYIGGLRQIAVSWAILRTSSNRLNEN